MRLRVGCEVGRRVGYRLDTGLNAKLEWDVELDVKFGGDLLVILLQKPAHEKHLSEI